jgi:hypothetical protein
MNKRRKTIFFMLVILLLIFISLACSMNGQQTKPSNTSFDDAHLIMITARDILGEYDVEEVASVPDIGMVLVSAGKKVNPQSTLEQLNQQFALGLEYKRLAQKAEQSGNNVLAEKFYAKAEDCFNRALDLESERQEWRRRHRFNSVINRGVKKLGQVIGNTLDFVGTSAGQYVEAEINGYVDQVRSFLQNPIRYAFDIKMGNKLDIVKHQFTDRLGPFFGQRVYELIGIDEAAWAIEEEIFATNPPEKTAQQNSPTSNSETPQANQENASFSDLAGKYSGTTTIGQDWENAWNGTEIENSMVLDINRNGEITGTIHYSWDEPWNEEEIPWQENGVGAMHYCSSKFFMTMDGTITGQLTNESSGTMEVTIYYANDFTSVDCPGSEPDVDTSFSTSVQFTVDKNVISGSSTEVYPFTFELEKE